jgi:hypothetical protein
MKELVYIAGPYTGGDPRINVIKAIDAAEKVAEAGYVPYVPHLNHLWDSIHPHDYEFWMEQGAEFLDRCDAVLRLPGESPGADREVVMAIEAGMHVYYGVEEFLKANTIAKADYT